MTCHFNRAANTEDISIIKSAKLWYILSGQYSILQLLMKYYTDELCFLGVNAQCTWSEEGVPQDLFGWKSGVCMCFVILKRLGTCIDALRGTA